MNRFTTQIGINFVDKIHDYMALYPSLAYINLSIALLFYATTIAYLLNKLPFKSLSKIKANPFYSNLFNLTLCSVAIAWGWRFIPPEFIDSVPLRILLHPRYFATFIYDATIFLTLFMLLLQIPKLGRYFLYLTLMFIFVYSLVAFATFYHIKRLPSKKEFELGGQILLISPIDYLILALKSKSILFIISCLFPLVITVITLAKTNLETLIIKPFLSFKTVILFAMVSVLILGLWVLEIPIKNNPGSFRRDTSLTQNINRLGLFKYQLFLLNSDLMHKTSYRPDLLKKQVDELLIKYPADKLETNDQMPQVILGWASEAFAFPENIDQSLKNQDKINPNFKKLLKQGVAGSLSSCFPLFGGGTVMGEATLLANMHLDIPKQNHPSLVSYYKSLGYTTVYAHVVYDSFYGYQERSKFYGFDEIYLGSYFKDNWGNDKALFAFIQKRIQKAIANNEKLFISFVELGRHGPHEFYNEDDKEKLIRNLSKTYGTTHRDMLNYIYKGNIIDNHLGKLVDFISKQKSSIAMMINADHVPGNFENKYTLVDKRDEASYMSNFLFYHNQKNLTLPSSYNYIHQSLVPSLFLQALGMPLRPLDKYILEESKTQKTYKLPIMEQLPYDITLGQQVAKPIYQLKE